MKVTKKNDVPSCENCGSREGSIFCKLNHSEVLELTDNKTHNLYKKGQVIFYEGNQPQGLFCIYSGKVKIHKLGDDGKEQIVRFAKRGNVLGYRALLSGDAYYASATALEDTLVCYLSKQTFTRILQSNTELSMQTIKMLSEDLRSAEQKIMNMAQKHVRERIAEALLMLKEYYGLEDDKVTINTTLTREDIANIAGTSTETSIRVLSELNKDNIISLQGKKIRIVNLNELVKTANLQE